MEFENVKQDLISTVTKDVNDAITKTLDDKLDGIKEYLKNQIDLIKTEYDQKISELTTKINNLIEDKNKTKLNKNEDGTDEGGENENMMEKFEELTQKIDNQVNKLKTLKDDQEMQIDRNLRSTLIFRNIKFNRDTEYDANRTIDILATAVNSHCPELGIEYFKGAVERGHRNFKPDRIITNRNKDSQPSISVKFLSWRDSNNILSSIIKANKDRKLTNIVVSQQFSKGTTRRRNAALERRKTLLTENQNMEYRLVYPATLTGRLKNSSDKFKTVEKF